MTALANDEAISRDYGILSKHLRLARGVLSALVVCAGWCLLATPITASATVIYEYRYTGNPFYISGPSFQEPALVSVDLLVRTPQPLFAGTDWEQYVEGWRTPAARVAVRTNFPGMDVQLPYPWVSLDNILGQPYMRLYVSAVDEQSLPTGWSFLAQKVFSQNRETQISTFGALHLRELASTWASDDTSSNFVTRYTGRLRNDPGVWSLSILDVQDVSEPGTTALLACGMVAMLTFRRRAGSANSA